MNKESAERNRQTDVLGSQNKAAVALMSGNPGETQQLCTDDILIAARTLREQPTHQHDSSSGIEAPLIPEVDERVPPLSSFDQEFAGSTTIIPQQGLPDATAIMSQHEIESFVATYQQAKQATNTPSHGVHALQQPADTLPENMMPCFTYIKQLREIVCNTTPTQPEVGEIQAFFLKNTAFFTQHDRFKRKLVTVLSQKPEEQKNTLLAIISEYKSMIQQDEMGREVFHSFLQLFPECREQMQGKAPYTDKHGTNTKSAIANELEQQDIRARKARNSAYTAVAIVFAMGILIYIMRYLT